MTDRAGTERVIDANAVTEDMVRAAVNAWYGGHEEDERGILTDEEMIRMEGALIAALQRAPALEAASAVATPTEETE
jgi:hypothetical protein